MKTIKCLLFAITLLFGVPAGAVTVSLTGNWVGLEGSWSLTDSAGHTHEGIYWGGVVELDIDGKQYMAMPTLPNWSPTDAMGVSWEADLYTRDYILAGGSGTVVGDSSVLYIRSSCSTCCMAIWLRTHRFCGSSKEKEEALVLRATLLRQRFIPL